MEATSERTIEESRYKNENEDIARKILITQQKIR